MNLQLYLSEKNLFYLVNFRVFVTYLNELLNTLPSFMLLQGLKSLFAALARNSLTRPQATTHPYLLSRISVWKMENLTTIHFFFLH